MEHAREREREERGSTLSKYDFDENGNRMMGGPFIGVNGASETDMLDGLDPGIARTVAWLRAHGFVTTDSGDGRTKFEKGWTEDDGVLPYPHVVIQVQPQELVAEAERLCRLLHAEHGVTIEPTPPEPPDPPQIDATYSVASGVAMIELKHVDDSMLRPAANKEQAGA